MIGIHHGRGVVALMKRPISGEHDLGVRIGEITLRLGFGRGRGRRLCSLAGGGVVIIATLTGLGFGLFAGRLGGLGLQRGLGFPILTSRVSRRASSAGSSSPRRSLPNCRSSALSMRSASANNADTSTASAFSFSVIRA